MKKIGTNYNYEAFCYRLLPFVFQHAAVLTLYRNQNLRMTRDTPLSWYKFALAP